MNINNNKITSTNFRNEEQALGHTNTNVDTYQHASGKKYIKRKARVLPSNAKNNNNTHGIGDDKRQKCRVDKCESYISTQTNIKTSYCNKHKCSEFACHRSLILQIPDSEILKKTSIFMVSLQIPM